MNRLAASCEVSQVKIPHVKASLMTFYEFIKLRGIAPEEISKI